MPKTLLLADDSVVIQKLVGLSFANEDVELVTTDNGDDAIAKAREARPDAVLADVVMPGLSGYEVCEAIKQDPDLRDTPVLLLTGTFEAFDEERAREVGSDGHITKPFEAQALVERVNELLARDPGRSATAAPATAEAEDFDFFDEDMSGIADARGTDVTLSSDPITPASEVGDNLAADDLGFAFGDDAEEAMDVPEVLGEPLDLDAAIAEPGEDHTVALAPPSAAGPLSPGGNQETPTVTSLAFQDGHPTPTGSVPSVSDLDPALAETPAGEPTSPWSATASETTAPPETPSDPEMTLLADVPPVPMPGSAAAEPSLTTIIMSDGDSSSDDISFGEAGLADRATQTPEPLDTPVASLDDDLFGDAPSFAAEPDPASLRASSPTEPPPLPARDDVFDFDTADSDPVLGSAADPFAADVVAAPPPAAAGYDVSSSDLGDPLAQPAAPEIVPDEPLADAPAEDVSLSEDLLDGPVHEIEPEADEAGTTAQEQATTGSPDITPVMRQRIHETLERVAWEAFADLSETMVKQVLERVETIAWEVIPQMAEALVKDEIRRMKDEGED